MSFEDKLAGDTDDPVVREALKNFKASVDAWSEAAYSRPRTVKAGVRRNGWWMAAGWALGCVLAAGSLTAGLYGLHHQQEMARLAAARTAAQKAAQQQAAAQRQAAAAQEVQPEQAAVAGSKTAAGVSNTDDDLLATVASDVSQQVPSAMEPLAQLMDENGTTNKSTR